MHLVLPEPRGDAATKHLVTNNKPLTFTVLSKITRPLDPHFGGHRGSLSAISAVGALGLCCGTRRNCYGLEVYGELRRDESIRVNFSGCFLSAFPIPKGSVRPKRHHPPCPEHGQAEPPLPDGGMGRGPMSWALPEFCWALQFFKLALNNSALDVAGLRLVSTEAPWVSA